MKGIELTTSDENEYDMFEKHEGHDSVTDESPNAVCLKMFWCHFLGSPY
jgi:hypothetical protein